MLIVFSKQLTQMCSRKGLNKTDYYTACTDCGIQTIIQLECLTFDFGPFGIITFN